MKKENQACVDAAKKFADAAEQLMLTWTNNNFQYGGVEYPFAEDFDVMVRKIKNWHYLTVAEIEATEPEAKTDRGEIKFATRTLINSVWLLRYRLLENGKVEILSHKRDTDEAFALEDKVDYFRLLENQHRTVTGVLISPNNKFASSKEYSVINCKHVFNY
jgi:hypothetical protein